MAYKYSFRPNLFKFLTFVGGPLSLPCLAVEPLIDMSMFEVLNEEPPACYGYPHMSAEFIEKFNFTEQI